MRFVQKIPKLPDPISFVKDIELVGVSRNIKDTGKIILKRGGFN